MGFEMQTGLLGTSPYMFASGLDNYLENNYSLFHDAWINQ